MTVLNRIAKGALAVLLGLLIFLSPGNGAESRSAAVISLDGAIGPASADYVVRSLHEAERQGRAAVVLRLDTPGGLDTAMRSIIRAMLASRVPVLAYVAPSGARAASAGTYILYASALAAMAPGTNLGAATPVAVFGEAPPPAPDTLARKATNDAAAYIRSLANLHGRNADWAEQAVRQAVSLPSGAALDAHVIEIVATDVPDLLAQADGHTVIVAGKTVSLATRGLVPVSVEPDWRDRLLTILTDPNIVYLLLLAGMFGLAFEASHPGLFAPGVFGAICLLVGGWGLDLLPVDYAGLALALLGLGLMVAEAFVPAFGAFVLGGAAAFAIGSLMMFEAPGYRLSRGLIVGTTALSAVVFAGVLALLIRARRRPVVTGGAAIIGAPGETLSWIGDHGEVLVHGERWRALAALPLAPGQHVRVTGRQGLTLRVEPR